MVSRNADLLNSFVVPQQSFDFGMNGEIARNTVIGININADRLASPVAAEASWVSRSSVRVTRSFQTGTGRTPTSILGAMGRHSGTGTDRGHGVQRLGMRTASVTQGNASSRTYRFVS